MEVDALHWPIHCRLPVLATAVRGQELVELADDCLDAAEDDPLGGSEAAVCPACASKVADERQEIDGRHVETCCVNVHCNLALQRA